MDHAPTLLSYVHCLIEHPHYRNLWLADFIDNIGSWLSYVATLELINTFSNGSGLALTVVILVRFFPSLLLSPIAGVLADKCNRIIILIVAALADAVIVASLVFVRSPSHIAFLFLLLTLQFTAIALQEPARKAIVPVLVPERHLHLATTLETFSWSLTGAIGGAVGGVITSKLGIVCCFLIDAGSYLLAAWFAYQVPLHLGDPNVMMTTTEVVTSSTTTATGSTGIATTTITSIPYLHKSKSDVQQHTRTNGKDNTYVSIEMVGGAVGGGAGGAIEGDVHHRHVPVHKHMHTQNMGPIGTNTHIPHAPLKHSSTTTTTATSSTSSSIVSTIRGALVGGWATAVAGWRYLLAPENRDVAFIVTMKGCGSFTWGAVDVINVKLSELYQRHDDDGTGDSTGFTADGPTTLGLIFCVVGLGCFVGPILFNYVINPKPRPLLWACVVSFGCLFAGSVVMATARNLPMVLVATLVRAIGSASLWIYSTLILQLRCPNSMLGRISAAEAAGYAVAEAASSVFGGAALDLGMSLEALTATLAVVSGLVFVFWVGYASWGTEKENMKAPTTVGGIGVEEGDGDEERTPLVKNTPPTVAATS